MDLFELKKKLDKKAAQKELLEEQLSDLRQKKRKLKKLRLMKERALELVKDVALKTQNQLEFHLSDMVSAGLNSVFDDSYDFHVKFEERRNGIECDLMFKKGEELIDPLKFSGLGAADIAAFSLRCAAWSMDKRYRNVMILDEPFKHLKGGKENIRAIKLMKVLSEKLNLQIICINDERAPRDDIIINADRVFEVKQNKKVSKVELIK